MNSQILATVRSWRADLLELPGVGPVNATTDVDAAIRREPGSAVKPGRRSF
jgi:hypothetical protein